jgi:sugar (pentulose or hexulose) kinase
MNAVSLRHIAVIDIGKTNAKVALVDAVSMSEIAVRQMPNRMLQGPPYPHCDVEGLWVFILASLASLNADQTIDAISVTTHGATAALLDGDGMLALPILDYEHRGPEELSAAYESIRPDFAETGSPRLPAGLNLGAQLFWQEGRFPADFVRIETILPYPQYWSYRLTGILATEMTSLGCHTDLWKPFERRYSGLVDERDWHRLMPPLRKANETLGPILPELAARTGLKRDCLVGCGIHDSNASLLPHLLAATPPFSVVSTGTWVIVMAVGGPPTRLDPARDTLVNVNAFGDPVPSARFMGGREYALALGESGSSYDATDLACVLEDRTMLLPSLQGGSGPYPERQGGWTCDLATLTPGRRAAATACYLALMTATCLDMIKAEGPVLVEGAFGRDANLPSLIATFTGRPVLVQDGLSTGTSIGAALLMQPTVMQPIANPVPERNAARNQLPATAASLHRYAAEWSERINAVPSSHSRGA